MASGLDLPLLEDPSGLATRLAPIPLDNRGDSTKPLVTSPETAIAFEQLGAALLVPLRPGGEATAFVCLGGKRSGDVYTTTDRALLASVGHAASAALTPMRGTN
jgi:GAF domain-containing protein